MTRSARDFRFRRASKALGVHFLLFAEGGHAGGLQRRRSLARRASSRSAAGAKRAGPARRPPFPSRRPPEKARGEQNGVGRPNP